MKPIRILIVDDHAILRDGMRALLSSQPDFSVVGEAAHGLAAVQEAVRLRPDVVVIDIVMPEMNGITAAERIRQACPATQMVVLSAHVTSEHIFRAFKAGALGYVLKESAGRDVLDAIRAVHAGIRHVSPRIADLVAGEFVRLRLGASARSPLETLSEREREVLQLVAEGQTSAKIATQLGLSVKTVETYRKRIMDKLGVHDHLGLIRFAIQHGLAPG